ncbi:hypothetical protein DICPUDRAFT_82935 [Dictyostelium purpureum]|uniref:B box-type domain-containing protein n=1 Tax=Dictyostelium purpureum TaxID=5786 RepID=F0ZY24_DICPU|nr:uncharacterized protein DICPUDRAFT_82935 [Dictyostelium purpureum]EGC31153.1 hypothetical protein DICPUDRAFT_82935 [Dictyostelium purpureum]|eukprot:XP_003292319.1 hypothetical protein DICPUDRAFT_82935 [Dictyostelium purpureum]
MFRKVSKGIYVYIKKSKTIPKKYYNRKFQFEPVDPVTPPPPHIIPPTPSPSPPPPPKPIIFKFDFKFDLGLGVGVAVLLSQVLDKFYKGDDTSENIENHPDESNNYKDESFATKKTESNNENLKKISNSDENKKFQKAMETLNEKSKLAGSIFKKGSLIFYNENNNNQDFLEFWRDSSKWSEEFVQLICSQDYLDLKEDEFMELYIFNIYDVHEDVSAECYNVVDSGVIDDKKIENLPNDDSLIKKYEDITMGLSDDIKIEELPNNDSFIKKFEDINTIEESSNNKMETKPLAQSYSRNIGHYPKKISFDDNFNEKIKPGSLSYRLTTLTFGHRFNQVFTPGSLPNRLTTLTFGDHFNQVFVPGTLPNSLTTLTFGSDFNQIIAPGTLPNSLTKLTFGDRFNQIIAPGTLPNSLTTLIFGLDFNKVITPGTLLNGLTTLTFGYRFNQIITPGTLPNTITKLTFNHDFNQAVTPGLLPKSLTTLRFGDRFNQAITPDTLPNSLTTLIFGNRFNQVVTPETLPNSLTILTFGLDFNQVVAPGSLPNRLTTLKFGFDFNQIITPGTIPNSLTTLTFGYKFNQVVAPGTLPNSIKTLIFGHRFNQVFELDSLPNYGVNHWLPSSLETLVIGDKLVLNNKIDELSDDKRIEGLHNNDSLIKNFKDINTSKESSNNKMEFKPSTERDIENKLYSSDDLYGHNFKSIKCLDHPHHDIVFVCSTCPNITPVCIDCINGVHRGHIFKSLEDNNIRNQIHQDFKNQTIPKLNKYLENNKKILDESNNNFEQILDNHRKNFDITINIFKQLKNIMNSKENDVKRLLTTKLQENIEVNEIITTTIEDNNNKINNAIKFNVKYKDTEFILKESNIDLFKDLINSYLEVFVNGKYFTINEEESDISHLEIEFLAIGLIQSLPKTIPRTITPLNFNQLTYKGCFYKTSSID